MIVTLEFTFMAVCCLLTDPTPRSSTIFNHPSTLASTLENEMSGSTFSPPCHSLHAHLGETNLLPELDSAQEENQPSNFQYSTVMEDHSEKGELSQPNTKLKDETATPERKKEMEDKESPKPKPPPVSSQLQCNHLLGEVGPETRGLSFDRGKPKVSRKPGIEPEERITVGQLFKKTVEKFPKHSALKYKEDGKWKTFTYTKYYDLCVRAAKSFLKVRVRNTVFLGGKNKFHVLAS